jgi:hypothetical protein
VSIAPAPREIAAFALRVICWSVAAFALWYAATMPVSMAAAWGAARILEVAEPFERAHPAWRAGSVLFQIEVDATTRYRDRITAGTTFEVPADPRKQTYGLPFFLALLLASRPRRIAVKALGGATILVMLAAIGVASEVAVQLGALPGPTGAPLLANGAVATNLAALGFQLGTLIFPTVVPVMLWVAMDTRLVQLIGKSWMNGGAHAR